MKVLESSYDWKPVDFENVDLIGKENLLAFEELSDYCLSRGDGSSETVTRKRKNKRKKNLTEKKKKIAVAKNVFTVTENTCQDISPSADDREDYLPWSNIFVPDEITSSLLKKGFKSPTEIQRLTIPAAIKGRRDILGAAETGSGKTLAFGIPIIYGIIKNMERLQSDEEKNRLWALILTPTRELAVQIKGHIDVAAKETPVKSAVIVGGLSAEKQSRILRRKPHIVIATPGRLWDLIRTGEEHFSGIHNIRFLAIDETDRMLEKNHFPELQSLLEKLNVNTENKSRQNFVFSATLSLVHQPPKHIKKKRWRKSTESITLTSGQKLKFIIKVLGMSDPKIVDITNNSGTAETLTERRILCNQEDKDFYLYYFLMVHPGRTLVFCNSIDSVKRLTSILNLLRIRTLPLHSNMLQKQRLKNLERFSEGIGVLLATDVASRGLDIPATENVIHYQVPMTSESYVHRSGRTARALRPGLSVVLVSPHETTRYSRTLVTLKRETEPPEFPVDSSLLIVAKQRVLAARQLDVMLLRKKREADKRSWLEKAAEEADLMIDEDLQLAVKDSREESMNKKALAAAKRNLDELLKRDIIGPRFSAIEKTTECAIKPKIKVLKKKKS